MKEIKGYIKKALLKVIDIRNIVILVIRYESDTPLAACLTMIPLCCHLYRWLKYMYILLPFRCAQVAQLHPAVIAVFTTFCSQLYTVRWVNYILPSLVQVA